ncbi:MAG: glycosyltransferase [Acidobacteria bacterium]|nr:glycosyltransferase [Acidobacteriota bacterium]MBI3428059.1 glycosyltransferase [Acidobacteriota bacterium]
MPKVSVVIPVYNTAYYLPEAIESVLQQTYRDFEILVVDDGSTDNSHQVALSHTPRVKLIAQSNGGPASARNAGMRQAGGEYIAFLDSDDAWVEDKLAEQVELLDNNPAIGLVYGKAIMYQQIGRARQYGNTIGHTQSPTLEALLFGNFIPAQTVLFRRKCVEEIGYMKESAALPVAEDFEFWLRFAKNYPLAGINRTLAYYRIHENNLLGGGHDIEKGLKYALAALLEFERQYPDVWAECEVKRDLLFARMHIRAGFAWKQRGAWLRCFGQYKAALNESWHPRVWRWMVAAAMLPRWS